MDQGLAFIDSVSSAVAYCAVLAGALGYAFTIYRQRYLMLWAIFWALYVVVWGMDGVIASLAQGSADDVIVRAVLTVCSLGARALLAFSVGDYLGWRPPSRRLVGLAAGTVLLLTAAGAAVHWLTVTGRAPPWAALPFRTYFIGLFLDAWLTYTLLRSSGGGVVASSRLLGIAMGANLLSDGLDVALELFIASPWTSQGRAALLSSFVAHVCDALFATGMMVAAIGTEHERAEIAAAALRERDARLQESQRRQMLGQLAGGLAHDFNNLLTAVIAHLSFAREALPAGSEARADVDTAAEAAERGSRLTRQILTFARRQPVDARPLDLNELVAGLERLSAPLLGERVAREVLLAPDVWPVSADPTQLEQLLLNLIVNAREALPGGGSVKLRTANAVVAPPGLLVDGAEIPPGDWVCLSVEDSGQGMDEATRARVFEPFFTTKERGTGLGLATVLAIAQQAGGQITLRTAPGAGACFTLWLPRSARPPPPPSPAAPAPAGGRETVLLVEDEPQLRALGVRTLEGRGYKVLPKASAEEALRIAPAELAGVALLVTDVVMPGLDGAALADALMLRHPDLRVLFMSGYAPGLLAERGRRAPLLSKPFTPDQLAARVRELLDERPQRRGL